MSLNADDRIFLALAAASTAVGICLYQHHFTLELNWPSLMEATKHKCGKLLTAMVCWLTLEIAWRARRTVRRPLRTPGIAVG